VYLNLTVALGLQNCYIALIRGQATIVFIILVKAGTRVSP